MVEKGRTKKRGLTRGVKGRKSQRVRRHTTKKRKVRGRQKGGTSTLDKARAEVKKAEEAVEKVKTDSANLTAAEKNETFYFSKSITTQLKNADLALKEAQANLEDETQKADLQWVCIKRNKSNRRKSWECKEKNKAAVVKIDDILDNSSSQKDTMCMTDNVFFEETKGTYTNKITIESDDDTKNYPSQIKCNNLTYKYKKHLGAGSFGTVYLYKTLNDDKTICLKIEKLVKNNPNPSDNMDEYIYKKLKYSKCNMIRVREAYRSESMVYNIMDGFTGSLKQLIETNIGFQPTPPMINAWYMIVNEVVKQLVCMKKHGIIYTDLKPDNVLYCISDNKFTLHIGDLGGGTDIESPGVPPVTYPPPDYNYNNYSKEHLLSWGVGVLASIIFPDVLESIMFIRNKFMIYSEIIKQKTKNTQSNTAKYEAEFDQFVVKHNADIKNLVNHVHNIIDKYDPDNYNKDIIQNLLSFDGKYRKKISNEITFKTPYKTLNDAATALNLFTPKYKLPVKEIRSHPKWQVKKENNWEPVDSDELNNELIRTAKDNIRYLHWPRFNKWKDTEVHLYDIKNNKRTNVRTDDITDIRPPADSS